MRIRAKFRCVGVEDTEYKVFKKVYQDQVSESEYEALVGHEYSDSPRLGDAMARKYKSVDSGRYQQNVRLAASYDATNPEDVSFSEATPSGEMRMFVTNPAVIGHFKPGKNYYIDLTPAE